MCIRPIRNEPTDPPMGRIVQLVKMYLGETMRYSVRSTPYVTIQVNCSLMQFICSSRLLVFSSDFPKLYNKIEQVTPSSDLYNKDLYSVTGP